MSGPVRDLGELLRSVQPQLQPGEYVYAQLDDPARLSELAPLASFREPEGMSLVLEREVAERARLNIVFHCRWISLQVHSDLAAVGLTAAVAAALSRAGISCNVVAAFHHDHLFVPSADAERALSVLQQLQIQAQRSATAELSAVSLLVHDYDQARDWFVDCLGFVLLEDSDLGAGKRWLRVAPSAHGTALLLARAANEAQRDAVGQQFGGRVGLFLNSTDFWSDYQRMRSRGVRFIETPREEPYATVAVFEDLYGNRWDLLQPRNGPAG